MPVFIRHHVTRQILVRLPIIHQNAGQRFAVRAENHTFDRFLARQRRKSKRKIGDDLSFTKTDNIGLFTVGDAWMVEALFGRGGVQANVLQYDAVAARLYPLYLELAVLFRLAIVHPVLAIFLDFDEVDADSRRWMSLHIEDRSAQPAVPEQPEGDLRAFAIRDCYLTFLL